MQFHQLSCFFKVYNDLHNYEELICRTFIVMIKILVLIFPKYNYITLKRKGD